MAKKLIIIYFLLLPVILTAAYIENFPVQVKQPDGTVIYCFATGDEYYNWLHDEENYTIIQSQRDGYYYYAILDNGKLVPSRHRVDLITAEKAGLKPGINISAEQIKNIRKKMEEQIPPPPQPVHTRSEGDMNNIVIYLRFADQEEYSKDTTTYYEWLNAPGTGENSLHNYFQEASYDKLSIVSWFYPNSDNNNILSYQDSYPRNYFMPYNAVTNPEGYQNSTQMINREHALLERTISYINQNYPVSQSLDLDFNNDDRVDNVIFIVRGAPTAWATLLWPHRTYLYSRNVEINGKRVWDYNFQIETHLNSSGVGVLCHEMFHTLGAPDLYHYTNGAPESVGDWDIMDNALNPPQHMGAYMKFRYGKWIDSIPEITERGSYSIRPLSESSNNCFKIPSPNSDTEFFVIEYRQKSGIFEGELPQSGLLIYRIDTTAGQGNAAGPPDEVYLYRPGGGPQSEGYLNEAVFGIEHRRTEFNDHTDPYCFLQDGGPGGLKIFQISEVSDSMSFYVDLPGVPEAHISASAYIECPGNKISFYDESYGYPEQWEWSFEPANVIFTDGTGPSSQHPVVIFSDPGIYRVNLTVSNEFGSDDITIENMIEIGSAPGEFAEDFESLSLNTNSWLIENPDDDITWEITEVGGTEPGNYAIKLDFRNAMGYGHRDRLISKPLDLSMMNTAHLYFEHAWAQYNSQVADSLIIYISNDCGESWSRIFEGAEDGSGNFATHPLTNSPFVPQSADDWCLAGYGSGCNMIDISEWIHGGPVKIAFETFNMFGNAIYLDNIHIGQTVGIDDWMPEVDIKIYPNPSSGLYSLELPKIQKIAEVKVYNLQGQLMKEFSVARGNHLKNFSLEELPDGLYMLSVFCGEKHFRRKIMKQ